MSDELNASVLGTKTYWDNTYSKELSNFQESGDCGEVWFGEDSVERLVNWMEKKNSVISKDDSILDLGCGNGVLLIKLYKNGYTDLTGVDYSTNAIDLARAVAAEQNIEIKYETCDILTELSAYNPESTLRRTYNVLVDKGTYDAISLNPENPEKQRAKYIESTCALLKNNGIFIITSCNWTEDELLQHFSKDLNFYDKIPVPTFQFGGVTGNRETVLVFQKADDTEIS